MFQGAKGKPSSIPPGAPLVILIIAALWIFWGFGYDVVWKRFTTQADGVVISSRDVPSKAAPRYATEYVIRGPMGQEQRYVAGATDGSLERSIPVGARIHKEWGELGYEVNGKRVGFPVYAYSALFGLAFGCLLWAWLLWRQTR
jgi:hypothetical protein